MSRIVPCPLPRVRCECLESFTGSHPPPGQGRPHLNIQPDKRGGMPFPSSLHAPPQFICSVGSRSPWDWPGRQLFIGRLWHRGGPALHGFGDRRGNRRPGQCLERRVHRAWIEREGEGGWGGPALSPPCRSCVYRWWANQRKRRGSASWENKNGSPPNRNAATCCFDCPCFGGRLL